MEVQCSLEDHDNCIRLAQIGTGWDLLYWVLECMLPKLSMPILDMVIESWGEPRVGKLSALPVRVKAPGGGSGGPKILFGWV